MLLQRSTHSSHIAFFADKQLFGEKQPNDHSIEQAQSHNDDRESGILVAYQLQTAHGYHSHDQGHWLEGCPQHLPLLMQNAPVGFFCAVRFPPLSLLSHCPRSLPFGVEIKMAVMIGEVWCGAVRFCEVQDRQAPSLMPQYGTDILVRHAAGFQQLGQPFYLVSI
jgi:hypothetical protein